MQRRATAHARMHAQRRGSAGASRATQHSASARRWLVLALGTLVPTTALSAATNRIVLEVESSAGGEDNPTLSADHPRTTGLFELALRAPLAHVSETTSLTITPHGRQRGYSDDAVARSQSYGLDIDASHQQPRYSVYGDAAMDLTALDDPLAASTGVFDPERRIRTARLRSGARWRLDERSELALDADLEDVQHSQNAATRNLIDYKEIDVAVQYAYTLDARTGPHATEAPRQALQFGGGVSRFDPDHALPRTNSTQISAGYSWRPTLALSVEASVAMVHERREAVDSNQTASDATSAQTLSSRSAWRPQFSGQVSYVLPHRRIHLNIARAQQPSSGGSPIENTRIGLDLRETLTANMDAFVAAEWNDIQSEENALPEVAEDASSGTRISRLDGRTTSLQAGLLWRINQSLRVGAVYQLGINDRGTPTDAADAVHAEHARNNAFRCTVNWTSGQLRW